MRTIYSTRILGDGVRQESRYRDGDNRYRMQAQWEHGATDQPAATL